MFKEHLVFKHKMLHVFIQLSLSGKKKNKSTVREHRESEHVERSPTDISVESFE